MQSMINVEAVKPHSYYGSRKNIGDRYEMSAKDSHMFFVLGLVKEVTEPQKKTEATAPDKAPAARRSRSRYATRALRAA